MVEKKIVTICGSMRFCEEMMIHAERLTRAGVIVLMPFVAGAYGEKKVMLDELHLRKIDMSHGILVVNPGRYVGDSTSREICYAIETGKEVLYTDGPAME